MNKTYSIAFGSKLDGGKMGKIRILVDYTDNFSACPENDKIACVTTANSYESLKINMDESLHFHIEGMKEDGETIPEEFSGEWEYEWVLSTRALLHATEHLVSKSAIAKVTGINQQQLTHYASGFRKPKPAMADRIREGVHSIALTLLSY